MILAIGWKNVWRSKTRSLVVIVAVMLGIFGGVMATGIMQGWVEQRIHDSIYKEISHIQIHNPEYMQNEEIRYTINDYPQVINVLDTVSDLVAYSPRVKLYAMARTSWAVSGFILKGVDPEKEEKVSEIYQDLVEGDFLEGDDVTPSIVIGSKAAENLKLLNWQVTPEKLKMIDLKTFPPEIVNKLDNLGTRRYRKEKDFMNKLKEVLGREEFDIYGEKLARYFSFYRMRSSIEISMQDKNGVIVHTVFKLRGVYKTDNTTFDGMNAFVERDVLNKYTGLNENEVHEIAIISADDKSAVQLAAKLKEYLPGQDILSWRELSPEIAMYTDFGNLMSYVYVVIILFALAFGIINTMMMSVLERVKELGMLMAIGMNKKRVFSMIMTESVFLTLTGAVAGMVFSGVLVEILSRTGINFSMWSEGFEALGLAAIVYPVVTWYDYIVITILVIITGMVASIWPARKALQLSPVEALRTE
jgi:ABC-type lipoprotein release transport system permease subunit